MSQEKSQVLERYQELYDNDPELRVVAANREGHIELLKNHFFEEKLLDVLTVTESEKWNWLHMSLLHIPNRDEWTGTPVEIVNFYIENKVPVNAQDCYGMTPLHYAMRGENPDAAIALLEAGADPNIPNRDNLRPLSMIGGMRDRLDILELMLKKGANVHNIINENESILESYDPDKEYALDSDRPIYEMMKTYS